MFAYLFSFEVQQIQLCPNPREDQCILYKVVDHTCVQVAVTDSYLMEGMKVLYRVVLAIIILFTKHAGNGMRGTGNAGHSIAEFCRHLPVPPAKLLKVW